MDKEDKIDFPHMVLGRLSLMTLERELLGLNKQNKFIENGTSS